MSLPNSNEDSHETTTRLHIDSPLVSGCAGVKDAVNPYEENFRCKAKDSEGKCLDTPTAYKEARLPDGQVSEAHQTTLPRSKPRTAVTKP